MCEHHHISRRDLLRTALAGAALGSATGLGVIDRVTAGFTLPRINHQHAPTLAVAQGADPLHFHGVVVTPEGTPLGGWVDVNVWPDGRYHVKFHMHSSSIFGDFDFSVRAYLSAPGFPTLAFLHSGHVSGVDSADHEEDGANPLIPVYWEQLRTGADYQVHKDYTWAGIVGGLAQLVGDILDLGAGFAGSALGVIIGATREATSWLDTTLGVGATIGVLSGVAFFGIGVIAGLPVGASLVAATVAGAGIGAIAESMIDSRPLNGAEIALGRQVFGDTLPYGDVILTNLGGASGRAFTAPGVDGKTYINLGSNYGDPIGAMSGSYPAAGQLLIHELTHAWQIAHASFLPGFMCSALVTQADHSFGDNVYDFAGPGPAWGEFNLEQQASIVDQWFGGNRKSDGFRAMDQASPYYAYVWNDVLGRSLSPTAPGNLRASSGLAVSQWPDHLDVFYPTPDGSVGSVWWDRAGTWSSPFTVAGPSSTTTSSIATVTRMPGKLDLFWGTPNGAVQHTWWDAATGWGSPHTIAGAGSAAVATAASGNASGRSVAVACQTPRHMDIFWIAPDGSIGTVWWDDNGNTWGSPYTIAGAGSAAGAMSAIGRKPGHLDIFWVAPDGSVISTWWDAAAVGWAIPFPVAPAGSAQPTGLATVCRYPEHIDVFYVAPDGSVGTAWWEPSDVGWRPPFTIVGPGSAAGAISAPARFPEHVDVYFVAPDGSIGTTWWEPTDMGWRQPFTIAGPGSASPISSITATNQSPLHLDVFWTAPDGAIGTTWWDVTPGWGAPYDITPPGVAAV